jgi:alpha/beta superfamily hydrolase
MNAKRSGGMLERFKANLFFKVLLRRHNIDKAYAMVGPEDSWYDTITTVHNSLAEIKQLSHENWEIASHDGLALKAVYYPGSSDKTMIWIHGYTSHAERESAFPALFYRSLGFNVLIPYLRTHGPSEGKYISFGALEHLDVMQWVDKVNELHPSGSIVIHGLSMGGGIVLDLAGKEMLNVKCLIADAPVGDIENSFRMMCNHVFKKSGNRVCELVLKRFQKEFGVNAAEFDRVKNISQGRYPLLLSAGSMENHEDLFEVLKENNPAQTTVVILPGCNHGNGMYKQTELYQGSIKAFLDKNMTV